MNSISDFLEQQLSRVTMYRLMIYGLVAISLVALLLMFVSYLPYSPLGFVVSIMLFVGMAYGANRLLGWLFGLRPHGESAIITGLILALLFVPPTTVIESLQLGLVAVIAMASKYILVYRGRHIFNPAAIAIVITSIVGLTYASWWIATPALIPVTAVVGFLVLFKTKRLEMASVFLLVAVATILLRTSMAGGLSGEMIMLTLTSFPLIFFGGIMLSEPLTLSPRRRQQLIEAAVVGVLFGSAFHFSVITMTPALALVIGNLLAWYWSSRGAIKLRLVSKKQMSPTSYDFTFESNKPAFVPGQYLELTLPHSQADARGMRRVFSIVGQSGEEHISIGTRLPEKPSSFKRALMALKPGQTVIATRIAGDFVLPVDESVPVVLIAGGIGITPYMSHIMAAGKRRLSLICVVNSSEDLAYVELLKQYDIAVMIVSPDDARLPDPDWQHVRADRLSRDILEELIKKDEHPTVYISGPPAMVDATKHIVKSMGLDYKTDHFAGY